MSHIELNESIFKTIIQGIAIKLFVIFIMGLVYLCTVGHVHAATSWVDKSTLIRVENYLIN